MKGIAQLLNFLNENWSFIIIIIGGGLLLYKKIVSHAKLSNDEKINAALCAIKNTIIGKMMEAQIDWYGIKEAGLIKRAKVISDLYNEYPVLRNYVNQEELIKQIDSIIDEALVEVKTLADTIMQAKQ